MNSGSDSIEVLITFDENENSEPRNNKFDVEEEVEIESKINTKLSFKWRELIEPRKIDN